MGGDEQRDEPNTASGEADVTREADLGTETLANQYEIRILADGRVVFGDLPQGLLEVARVVAGSEPGPQTVVPESENHDE